MFSCIGMAILKAWLFKVQQALLLPVLNICTPVLNCSCVCFTNTAFTSLYVYIKTKTNSLKVFYHYMFDTMGMMQKGNKMYFSHDQTVRK